LQVTGVECGGELATGTEYMVEVDGIMGWQFLAKVIYLSINLSISLSLFIYIYIYIYIHIYICIYVCIYIYRALPLPNEERSLIEIMTSDRKLKASSEGSKCEKGTTCRV